MSRQRRKYDVEFKEGAVRIVWETGKPIAEVARDLGINPGTLGNWVAKDAEVNGDPADRPLSETERAELERLREENVELQMLGVAPPGSDVLQRSTALWVEEAGGPARERQRVGEGRRRRGTR